MSNDVTASQPAVPPVLPPFDDVKRVREQRCESPLLKALTAAVADEPTNDDLDGDPEEVMNLHAGNKAYTGRSRFNDYFELVAPHVYQEDVLSCLPIACALAMSGNIKNFLNGFDHNPFEIIPCCENLPGAHRYRGYLYEECAYQALTLGWAATLFATSLIEVREAPAQDVAVQLFRPVTAYLSKRCVVVYQADIGCHAAAIVGGVLIDPASGVYKFNYLTDTFPYPIKYTIIFTRIENAAGLALVPIGTTGDERTADSLDPSWRNSPNPKA